MQGLRKALSHLPKSTSKKRTATKEHLEKEHLKHAPLPSSPHWAPSSTVAFPPSCESDGFGKAAMVFV